jgi:hypothetical protein
MIIWSGLGFVVPIIPIACFFVTQFALTSIFNDATYYSQHSWPKLMVWLMAVGTVGLVGWLLSRGSVFTDKTTGEAVTIRRSHTFFFIPVIYWAPIVAAIGLVTIFI